MKNAIAKTGAALFLLLISLTAAGSAQEPTTPPASPREEVTEARKIEFIHLLAVLPHEGESYTDQAVKKAEPYLPVLLALSEKELAKRDIYPFAAMIAGLCGTKPNRDYVALHFSDIRHPELRIFWAALLFDKNSASPRIVQFLRDTLKSDQQSQLLKEFVGPQFEEFRKRVLANKDSSR
jgi:hypothetical protein